MIQLDTYKLNDLFEQVEYKFFIYILLELISFMVPNYFYEIILAENYAWCN